MGAGGIPAVKLDLAVAVGYKSHGSPFAHLVELARHSPALFTGLAAAVTLWVPAYFASRGDETSRHDERLAV